MYVSNVSLAQAPRLHDSDTHAYYLIAFLYACFVSFPFRVVTQFRESAQTIRDATQFSWRSVLGATKGLSEVLTSQAIKTQSTWPFVTLDSFEVLVRNTRLLGRSELVVLAPLVHGADEIVSWNNYSNYHQGWLDESFGATGRSRDDVNPIPSSVYRFGRYKGRTVLKPETGHDEYSETVAPFWQMSRPPFDTSIINYNALSDEDYVDLYTALQQAQTWVVGKAGPNTLLKYTLSEARHDALHTTGTLEHNITGFANNHPHTALVYPVWKYPLYPQEEYQDSTTTTTTPNAPTTTITTTMTTTTTGNNNTLVAMVFNIVPWDTILQNILPPGVVGIDVVLHNTAGQTFTYRLDGPTASYAGSGDWHDTEYNHLEQVVSFGNPEREQGQGQMEYWFSIYPSRAFAESHDDPTAIIMTIGLAIVFIAMLGTFVLYDAHVVRKNNVILDAAANSNAILAVRLFMWTAAYCYA